MQIEGCHYAASGQYNFVRVGMPAWRQVGPDAALLADIRSACAEPQTLHHMPC
jgi:hypothetical protein